MTKPAKYRIVRHAKVNDKTSTWYLSGGEWTTNIGDASVWDHHTAKQISNYYYKGAVKLEKVDEAREPLRHKS